MRTDSTVEPDLGTSGGIRGRLPARIRESNGLAYLMVAPATLWYVAFLLLPLAVIVVYSFYTYVGFAVEETLTLATWTGVVLTSETADVFVRTLTIGLGVTALTLVAGYPLAYYLRFYASQNGGLVLLLFLIIPFWTAGLVRTAAWIPLLGRQGVVNVLLLWIGVVDQPLSWLLYSPFSQVVGYLQSYLVFMAAPIYISMAGIDDNLLDASETLRGDPLRTFRRVTWPLSLPGVAIGAIFVFVLSIGDFLVPQFLSGGQSTVTVLIYNYNNSLNTPAAAALSLALLAIILVCVFAMLRVVDISDIIRS